MSQFSNPIILADKAHIMGRVSGKVAIVTGAAQGLGEATARLLAAERAAVMLADLQQKGERVAASIRESGGNADFFIHDVTDESAWARLVAQTATRFGGLHVLVNNAGASAHNNTNPETAGLFEWQEMIDTNLKSVFLGVRAAIPAMHQTGRECAIVNLSSIHGLRAAPHRAPLWCGQGRRATVYKIGGGLLRAEGLSHPLQFGAPRVP